MSFVQESSVGVGLVLLSTAMSVLWHITKLDALAFRHSVLSVMCPQNDKKGCLSMPIYDTGLFRILLGVTPPKNA